MTRKYQHIFNHAMDASVALSAISGNVLGMETFIWVSILLAAGSFALLVLGVVVLALVFAGTWLWRELFW